MAATISEIIATLRQHISVTTIVVTHDRDLALTIADRVAILMRGKLVAVTTPAELRTLPDAAVQDFLNPKIDLQNPRFKHLEISS
jgi:phospholipid/cholesterol/gamma-HCH transport system ATP-binding protein